MAILNFIQENLRTQFGDFIFPIITYMGSAGIVWILFALYKFFIIKDKKEAISMIISLLLVLIICLLIIKPSIARPRPFMENTQVRLLIKPPQDFSFPSGHTASSFAVVTVMYIFKDKLRHIAMILAALISYSRLYLYVHYPSDVFFGLIFGVVFGFLAVLIHYFFSNRFKLVDKQKSKRL
ncbi:phosphatase PAP2 family protein [Peptostreptococcus equinus]|uniref:Phosphatase PAP2 family protein n=1 Tax=Peptostreptococcus equinus TaxID=3003601 RepID=A0ABY7JRI4_9FIRM|nr:phosphatase PAP2 family protein [Peptostreptococcus sp. CBA3647]WAW15740.1 phosphatase PAP2 family protein [Peptostreptococcus sp. CBA3647]